MNGDPQPNIPPDVPFPNGEGGPKLHVPKSELPEYEPERTEDPRPPYMHDDPSDGKTNYAKWGLMHDLTEDELIEDGANPGTVRVAAQELEKAGLRKRPPKTPPEGKPNGIGRGTRVSSKASPPEALIESMVLPMKDGQAEGFEQGMKFGASMIVLGVRIAQELSTIGVQQAKPLLDMAKDMRSGEAAAAKSSAMEAAILAASQVQADMAPQLGQLSAAIASSGSDPMKSMLVRTMEPVISNMMSKMLTGPLMGGTPAQASGAQAPAPEPSGWIRRKEVGGEQDDERGAESSASSDPDDHE